MYSRCGLLRTLQDLFLFFFHLCGLIFAIIFYFISMSLLLMIHVLQTTHMRLPESPYDKPWLLQRKLITNNIIWYWIKWKKGISVTGYSLSLYLNATKASFTHWKSKKDFIIQLSCKDNQFNSNLTALIVKTAWSMKDCMSLVFQKLRISFVTVASC